MSPPRLAPHRDLVTIAYAAILGAAATLWLLAIRAPLFLDETFSYWQITGGWSGIMVRRGSMSPAYGYILWCFTRLTGTSEIGLRFPSLLAMICATYVFFRIAIELYDRDVALITTILFCVHPIIIYAAIDARAYAFAALTINCAILALVKLRQSRSALLAFAYGIAAGIITHFQLVFCVLLPSLVFLLTVAGNKEAKLRIRQLVFSVVAFGLTFLPNARDLLKVFHSRQALVFDREAPRLSDLGWTLAPNYILLIFLAALFLAAITRSVNLTTFNDGWAVLLCVSVGLLPLLILYIVTANSQTNVFVERYRLVAIPGISLGWGIALSRVDSRTIRLLFIFAVVCIVGFIHLRSPYGRRHGYTWKYALEFADSNASPDNATVIICSDFPGSDYQPMPAVDLVKSSDLFSQVSYYPVKAPIVGLPRSLNEEAVRVGSNFVRQAMIRRQRFLALAFGPSLQTLRWLADDASDSFDVSLLGVFDGITVLEFRPRRSNFDSPQSP